VIEKHFINDRSLGGVDADFSVEPGEFTALIRETRTAWEAVGKVSYGPTVSEERYLPYRRSLYIVEDLQTGDVLTPQNLRAIRPGLGLSPKHLQELLGHEVVVDVKKGTAVNWEIIGK